MPNKKTKDSSAKTPTKLKNINPTKKQNINNSYKQTLDSVQKQLSAPSRIFSKFIHSPVIEKTSDILGSTIARPNLIIAGALGAIASIFIYIIAKQYGYLLSGSETIILFILGWCIGAIIEYGRVGLTNRNDK